ncbi:MAG: histidine kinase dimerization/phospho-acceptor domain-containing protein [Clostridiaceae bacterium]|nr:histidine kinase dimerization/phospho-acceptor domain-containing protein [Clostridiaceae bacterium]
MKLKSEKLKKIKNKLHKPHTSKRRLGVKWNLFLSFLLFSCVMLLLLWLFQIVFLDDFYRSIKTRMIESTAETLSDNIDNEELGTLINRMAQEHELGILILDENNKTIGYADVLAGGGIIRLLPANELQRFFSKAQESGGSYLEYFDRANFKDDHYDSGRFVGRVPNRDSGMLDTIIYARTVTLADGTKAVILLNAILTPVNSTVETLRGQLFIITIILVVLSLLLALILSKRVARPIIQINERSRELAKGNYQVQFESSGYKEIAELADTLNHAAVELNQVESLRRELIANVSHDLRTPLTMISGYAEVMRDLPGENSPENVQVIIDESKRLTTLVNDLLDLSRLQSGGQELKIQPYNLTESIRKTLERFNKLVEQDGYDIALQADQEAYVQADENRIDQVLHNLINNAINYTGADKKVTIRQIIGDTWVRIEVQDSGEGILPEQLPYIWDRYYKGSKVHRRAVVGTGLGLSIVKNILDRHQALFGVNSTPGQGSTFWFQLQLRP